MLLLLLLLLTSHPTPRLRTEGGVCVALANRAAAMNAPVDCSTNTKIKRFYNQNRTSIKNLVKISTSTIETNAAANITKASPAWTVGVPHCHGYGNLILFGVNSKVRSYTSDIKKYNTS